MPVQKFSTDYSGRTIEELQDALAMISRELNYLLNGNLDDDNVRANTITAGSVFAENIDTTNAKIGAAQIDDLTVGTNVAIGTAEDSAGVTTIVGNTITSGYISALSLTVGTEIGLGTAQDSAGVTTIVGNTVTTSFVNALSITAGSVSANNISAGTITGSAFQTATAGARVVISTAGVLQLKYNDTTLVEYGGSGSYGWIGAASNLRIDAGDTVSIGEYSSSISLNCDSYYADGSANTEIATRGWVSGSYMPQTWITNTYESHTHGTGSTGSDTSTASHNHGITNGTKLMVDGGGTVTYVTYGGDTHSHSIGTP